MSLKTMGNAASADDLRAAIVTDLRNRFPQVSQRQVTMDVERELRSFGEPPIRQYLPILVARRLQSRYRAPVA
jgi:hypothetical protein